MGSEGRRRRGVGWWAAGIGLGSAWLLGCDDRSATSQFDGVIAVDGAASGDGSNVPPPDDFLLDGGGGPLAYDDGQVAIGPPCQDGQKCAAGTVCKYGRCVADLGVACSKAVGCPGDNYCDTDGVCVPYGLPAERKNDPECARGSLPPTLEPTVQCEWPPASGIGNDAFPNHTLVYTTPVVADLNLDKDPKKIQPSIVVTTFFGEGGTRQRVGILRVFDGRTCTEQMRIGAPDEDSSSGANASRPAYGTQLAIGDLDRDVPQGGHPEIVGLQRPALDINASLRVVAYEVVDGTSGGSARLRVRWTGRRCGAATDTLVEVPNTNADWDPNYNNGLTNSANFGPGLWDLDDDGYPEVILDKFVFDRNGCLLNANATDREIFEPYGAHGILSTVADVDLDDKPDLVRADGIYEWVRTPGTLGPRLGQWVRKTFFNAVGGKYDGGLPASAFADGGTYGDGGPSFVGSNQRQGHVAVADFGAFSALPGLATERLPEVAVVSAEPARYNPNSTGSVRLQTLSGQILFERALVTQTQPWGGHGGAPTAADFDGDGQLEFAAAANEFYTVFDPDCAASVDKSKRPGGKCERPAWFLDLAGVGPNANPMTPKIQNIDGILWAQPSQDYSSSGTGSSIFDFNGDGKPEVVYRDECYLRVYDGPTGRVVYSAPGASGTGYEYPVIVDADGDFSTEIVVPRAKPVAGASPEKCAPTDPLFAGGISKFEYKAGFVVLRDPQDRWVPSRPIWNQHAYSVTHVNDDGTVPRSSQTKRNWEQKGSATEPALNNFRQNVQGSLAKVGLADLTATVGNIANVCNGQSGETPFQARVCNRGTNPVGDGVEIAFYTWSQGDGGTFSPIAPGASRICEVRTPRLLDVGDCVTVQCTGMLPAFRDVFVAVDPSGTVADCKPNNNNGVSARLSCPK